MATGAGLWDAGLRDWYGPGTPLVQRVRSYRPNRRGHIKLARWARIGCIRVAAVLLAVIALAVTLDPPPRLGHRRERPGGGPGPRDRVCHLAVLPNQGGAASR